MSHKHDKLQTSVTESVLNRVFGLKLCLKHKFSQIQKIVMLTKSYILAVSKKTGRLFNLL